MRAALTLALASVVAGLSESGILAILAQSAAAIVAGTTTVQVDLGPLHMHQGLTVLLAAAIGLAVVRLALQGVLSALPARIAADLQTRLRREVFAAFASASWAVQARDREGHFQEVMSNQTFQASQAALQATLLLVGSMSFLVLVISALVLNIVAAVLVLAAGVGLFALLRPLAKRGGRWAAATSSASLDFAGGVSEAVRLAEETKVFGVSAAQGGEIDSLTTSVEVPYYHTQFLARLVPGIYQGAIYLFVAGALLGLDLAGVGHVGSLGAVVLLLVRAGTYGQQAQANYQGMRQAIPFLDRVHEARDRYLASAPTPGRQSLGRVEELAFEHVSYAYEEGRPVLSDVSFAVSRRETVGIVGPTGAGKSTLVQVLLGLRQPSSGRYLVNGLSPNEIRPQDWQRAVAYLPQDPRLLHASVAENIRFYRAVDDESVERAARLAGIHEDILSWPVGYETLIGPRADAVSGGQQQRICLARALVTRPEILVLDEPTSALDPQTERVIQQSLQAVRDELTLFVVAHRMSTLDICERVIVLVEGRLQAFDTASNLSISSDYFRAASALALGRAEEMPPASRRLAAGE